MEKQRYSEQHKGEVEDDAEGIDESTRQSWNSSTSLNTYCKKITWSLTPHFNQEPMCTRSHAKFHKV
ncbi:hypothetical protein J4Q44_G00166490 [Coregonus suidteri]|uniref:Uncharacterized protein n=1 Tax=Coregonus suidteri TaxID=861788 RepID=A0AAN8LRW5_9TELE